MKNKLFIVIILVLICLSICTIRFVKSRIPKQVCKTEMTGIYNSNVKLQEYDISRCHSLTSYLDSLTSENGNTYIEMEVFMSHDYSFRAKFWLYHGSIIFSGIDNAYGVCYTKDSIPVFIYGERTPFFVEKGTFHSFLTQEPSEHAIICPGFRMQLFYLKWEKKNLYETNQ